MQDRPELTELLAAVRHFLESEVVPAAPDPRLRFRARIAANVLAVAERERQLEDSLLGDELRRLETLPGMVASPLAPSEAMDGAANPGSVLRERVEALNADLVRRIRSGAIDADPGGRVWEHLRRTAVEKLRIANPGYLERVGEED